MKAYILHGWVVAKDGENPLLKWDDFLNELRKKDITPHLLKVPGLTSDLEKVYELEDYILWLKKILEKEQEKIILIGHSNGGRIASAFSVEFPEKISHLVLIDSAGIYHNELSLRLKKTVFKFLAKAGKTIFKSEKLKILLYKLARERDYKEATEVQRKTMLNMTRLDLREVFKKVSVPTLIIWGKNDRQTPLADGKLINQLIKNSKLLVIDDARHSPQFTQAKEVVEKIVRQIL